MRLSLFTIIAVLILSGCNTMLHNSYQKIRVITPGVDNADCDLKTEGHRYRVLTPRRVMVERSNLPMTVTCEYPGYYTGVVTVESRVKMAATQLNVLSGWLPWTAYDVASNSIFDYPDNIVVTLHKIPVAEDMSPGPYFLMKKLKEADVAPLPLVVPLESKADESFKESLQK